MGSLRVEVADSGQGIATIEKDKIFRDPEQFDRNELLGGGEKPSQLNPVGE